MKNNLTTLEQVIIVILSIVGILIGVGLIIYGIYDLNLNRSLDVKNVNEIVNIVIIVAGCIIVVSIIVFLFVLYYSMKKKIIKKTDENEFQKRIQIINEKIEKLRQQLNSRQQLENAQDLTPKQQLENAQDLTPEQELENVNILANKELKEKEIKNLIEEKIKLEQLLNDLTTKN